MFASRMSVETFNINRAVSPLTPRDSYKTNQPTNQPIYALTRSYERHKRSMKIQF